jgi:ribA/ribD-fused uncharacterized protein
LRKIKGFFGRYEFLGNYHPSEVELDGIKGRTVEHVYQAMKSMDPEERRKIASQPSPDHAKKAGRMVLLRSDWAEVRIGIMEELVRWKFTRHEDLKERLLATGKAYLEETNDWGDRFWGGVRR